MTREPHSSGLFDLAMFAGQVSVQSLPVTVTPKEQVARSPAALLTSQLTVVVPTGKLEPDGGVQAEVSGVQLSG